MRIFRDSPEEKRIRWYFALPGARLLPFPVGFGSSIFTNTKDPWPDPPVGEIAEKRREFVKDGFPKGQGVCWTGSPEEWLRGVSVNDPVLPLPECCRGRLVSVREGSGASARLGVRRQSAAREGTAVQSLAGHTGSAAFLSRVTEGSRAAAPPGWRSSAWSSSVREQSSSFPSAQIAVTWPALPREGSSVQAAAKFAGNLAVTSVARERSSVQTVAALRPNEQEGSAAREGSRAAASVTFLSGGHYAQSAREGSRASAVPGTLAHYYLTGTGREGSRATGAGAWRPPVAKTANAYEGSKATATVSETGADVPEIGTIVPYAGGPPYPPKYLLCDGSLVSRTTYAVLFQRLGTTWGAGDGSTTFALPDLRAHFPVGVGPGGGGAGVSYFNLAGRGGAETHSLTLSELAPHGHAVTDPGHYHGTQTAGESFMCRIPTGAYTTQYVSGTVDFHGVPQTSTAPTGISVQSAGGGAAFQTLPPWVAINYLIYVGP